MVKWNYVMFRKQFTTHYLQRMDLIGLNWVESHSVSFAISKERKKTFWNGERQKEESNNYYNRMAICSSNRKKNKHIKHISTVYKRHPNDIHNAPDKFFE